MPGKHVWTKINVNIINEYKCQICDKRHTIIDNDKSTHIENITEICKENYYRPMVEVKQQE